MREVCVHDDHEVSSDEVQAMDISSSVFTIELWADSSKKMQHTLNLVFQHAVLEPIVPLDT